MHRDDFAMLSNNIVYFDNEMLFVNTMMNILLMHIEETIKLVLLLIIYMKVQERWLKIL